MNNHKIWLSSPYMVTSEQKYVQEAFDTNCKAFLKVSSYNCQY
jgi:hypothetical protein